MQGDLVAGAAPGQVAATDPGVLALGVLADHDPVHRRFRGVAQRAGDPRQELHRPHAGVLVEPLADREAEAPEGDVVGHVRPADGAEVDGVKVARRSRPSSSIILPVSSQ